MHTNDQHEKPALKFTRDYSLFDTHEHNRRQHEDLVLLESMKRYGFMPSSPLQVVRVGSRLKIIRGHHRFDCAKRLGVGVWYVVDPSNVDLFSLEATRQKWSVEDFTYARAQAGDEDCSMVMEFMTQHKLPIGAAASLVGGESASSNNKTHQLKNGNFKAAEDQSHALQVVAITDRCRAAGMAWASSGAFVAAVSTALRVPEFNASVFLHRLSLHGPQIMVRRSTKAGCLEEIEKLYNYAARERRLPLVYRAAEVMRARSAVSSTSETKNAPK